MSTDRSGGQPSDHVPFLDLGAMHAEIRDELDKVWDDALVNNGFIGGRSLDAFEREFAEFCGVDHAIGVANGTDALELILEGLGIGPGDEVIVPTNTFIATVSAVARSGATPVFVDVDPATALLTGDHIRAALSPRTAAVMAVHLYGQMVDLDDVASVTTPAGVALIEDAAQSQGAMLANRRAGSFGVATGFSFYPGKNLGALGDGGAIVTPDGALAERIRSIANHGRSEVSRYHHDRIGRNSRLDGLQAAALSVKLTHLDAWNAKRRALAAVYHAALPATFVPIEQRNGEGIHHLFVVASEIPRSAISACLDAASIGWGVHYPVPCHLQAPYLDPNRTGLPVSEHLAERIISLPMYPQLTSVQVERVCATLGELTGD